MNVPILRITSYLKLVIWIFALAGEAVLGQSYEVRNFFVGFIALNYQIIDKCVFIIRMTL